MGTRVRQGRRESIEQEVEFATGSLPQLLAEGLVFITSGAVLVLEILSVLLLAPYVGLTLEMTASIIGAALAGIAVGAALGGWMADRVNPHRLVVGLPTSGGLQLETRPN